MVITMVLIFLTIIMLCHPWATLALLLLLGQAWTGPPAPRAGELTIVQEWRSSEPGMVRWRVREDCEKAVREPAQCWPVPVAVTYWPKEATR